MSYMLDYYGSDYQPIGGSTANQFRAAKNTLGFGGNLIPLYNGNISAMSTTLRDIQTLAPLPQAAQYRYDQLNRITAMDVWQDLDLSSNAWDVSAPLLDYRTRYHYDPSGNLLRLQRNGDNPSQYAMDRFNYHYSASNNRLLYVSDSVATANYANDIDDQLSGNYGYDAIGNLTRDDAEEINLITWSVYGKVKSVGRTHGSSRPRMNFHYDASGQRVMKELIYGVIGSHIDSTVKYFYVRDASGNVMATYRHSSQTPGTPGLYLEEQTIYGSSRLGTRNQSLRVNISYSSPANMFKGISYVKRGYKTYELSNHLGNVLATVSDRRVSGTCTDSIVDFYDADILTISDYYPFGMAMDSRTQSAGGYRWGFNGQEKDNEVVGEGNVYAFEYRIHDSRLGRFLSVDPLESEYPWNSPYAFAENRVIDGKDLEGLEWENFMSGFKKPGELKVKLPNEETAQKQSYRVVIQNSKVPFSQFKEEFKAAPEIFLTNSKAEFNAPVDGEGKPSQFKAGSYIKIDIVGPFNNSYVMVRAIHENDDGSLDVHFVTMEGHVERGKISFSLSEDKEGNIQFEINSVSEVDYGLVPNGYAREQQMKSWQEVLTNIVVRLGGEEKEREIEIGESSNR